MTKPLHCDLCDDTGVLHLHARCHPAAPLRAETKDGRLTLYCYVPECNRQVAEFVFDGELERQLAEVQQVAAQRAGGDPELRSLLLHEFGTTETASLREAFAFQRGYRVALNLIVKSSHTATIHRIAEAAMAGADLSDEATAMKVCAGTWRPA